MNTTLNLLTLRNDKFQHLFSNCVVFKYGWFHRSEMACGPAPRHPALHHPSSNNPKKHDPWVEGKCVSWSHRQHQNNKWTTRTKTLLIQAGASRTCKA